MAVKSKNIQIKPLGKKGENKVSITFSNELTIYTIEEIKDDVIDAINKHNDIKLIGSDIKNMDLAFVQLISSIQRAAEKNKKKLELDFKLTEETQVLFENTDIKRILK